MNLDKILELIKSIKDNPTVLVTIVFASVGTIATVTYQGITYFNEGKEMVTTYGETASTASYAKRKVDLLEEKVISQQETIIKMQEKLSDALMASREAKVLSDSTQKELRAGLSAQKIELEVTAQSLKSDMNTLKRATTNRLGN